MTLTEYKSGLIGALSCFVFVLWFVLVIYLAPQYQNIAGSDSLAMINVLFPYFWVLLLAFVGICFVAFMRHGVSRWVHMLLVSQFALMLYYTPFLLGGFSWSPDSLWHGGIASYLPDVLSGGNIVLSDYSNAYPLSFFVTYLFGQVGVNVFVYSLYVYPVVCCVVFSVLAYFFAYRLFGDRSAFLALLFMLPALHYVEMHVSPFSAGTIITLIALILSTYQKKWALGLSFVVIVSLVIVHPISPLMLAIYLFSLAISKFIYGRRTGVKIDKPFFFSLIFLFAIVALWSAWSIFAASVYAGVDTALAKFLSLGFIQQLFFASEFTVGNAGFIYPWIHNLSLIIYGLIFVLMLVGNKPTLGNIRAFFGKGFDVLASKRFSLLFAAVIYAAMGFLLFLASGERFLLGRGLLYFIFMGSMVLATYVVMNGSMFKRSRVLIAFGLIIFLVCTFPIISYSKEAYNTYTPSANSGLSFVSNKIDLSQHSLSMAASRQLASYVDLTKGLDLEDFPPNFNSSRPDFIAMRSNNYFLISMRVDLSFTENSFTRLNTQLLDSSDYGKVYSNPNFDVYARTALP